MNSKHTGRARSIAARLFAFVGSALAMACIHYSVLEELPPPRTDGPVALGDSVAARTQAPDLRVFLIGDAGAGMGKAIERYWAEATDCSRPAAQTAALEAFGLEFGTSDVGLPRAALAEIVKRADLLDPLLHDVSSTPAGMTAAVWLGDNVYEMGVDPELLKSWANLTTPGGCVEPGIDKRAAATYLALESQVLVSSRAQQAVFVAGNHDWNSRITRDACGLKRLEAQQGLIQVIAKILSADDRIALLPIAGEYGPAVKTLRGGSMAVHAVFLDTEAILARLDSSSDSETRCPECGSWHSPWARSIIDSLVVAIQSAPRDAVVIVAGHHPVLTYGPHGARIDSTDVRGMLRGLLMNVHGHSQDVTGSANKKMTSMLRCAFHRAPPLLYASGHEHTLQVLHEGSADDGKPWLLVSGSASKNSAVGRGPGPGIRSSETGYMVLNVYADGEVHLEVYALNGHPSSQPGKRIRILLRRSGANPPPTVSSSEVRAPLMP